MRPSSGRLPFLPAYPEKKPDKVKWPTPRFAESSEDAANEIAKSRKKKNKRKKR